MSVAQRVRAIVEPLLTGEGIEIYDIEHQGGQLRITIERPGGGIDLDTISEVTRIVSSALDEHDPIRSRYTLEVSSPGLERALRTPAHFMLAIGQTVQIRTEPGIEGDRRIKGVIVAADDESVTVRVGDEPAEGEREGVDDGAGQQGERQLRYDQIERARTVFEWAPAVKPGKGSKPGRQKSQGRRSPSGSQAKSQPRGAASSTRSPKSHDERAREQ